MRATEQAAVESDASQRLIDNATEGMLGPNPFIGFRPQDIAAAFEELARQAFQHPAMVLAQEAALLRELMAILSGSSKLAAAPGDKQRARFAASLVTDALAPTNTLLGNPAALRSTLASGGANLLAGLKNMF